MDPFINGLYGIPLIGLVFQFIGYLVAQLPFLSHAAVSISIPICFAALCGVVCERSGVVNIGLEGIMLTAAFVGWIVGVVAASVLGHGEPTAIFGFTLPLLIALAAAIAAGMLLALLHAWLAISVRADQIISGTIINVVALGITGYLISLISKTSPRGAGSFQPLDLPHSISDLPVVGWLLNAFFDQGPIAISAVVIVVVFQVMLFRSRWGLRTRSVGEHPKAAETVGIDVIRLRYRNVVIGGALAALGGAYLSMEITNSFQPGMTQGRGFIGLAAMIVGRWTPLGAFGAAVLFASATAISQSITFAAPTGDLGNLLAQVPPQLFDALPYLITIVILAGVIGRSIPPAADGQPYVREAAS
jgi:general nucleoside transport system permease protein